MSKPQVTILGSNSAISVFDRFPSGQVLEIDNEYILIDCGEGTQFRMDQYGIRKSKINTILITHLHGDHVFGLPGLLTSYQLAGRKAGLKIYGPAPIQEYLDINLGGTGHFIDYPLEIVELDFEELQSEGLVKIDSLKQCEIYAFELIHRIDCAGYLVKQKEKNRKIRKDFLEEHQPHVQAIKDIVAGKDFVRTDGEVISNENCTMPPEPPRSYAYCSDTIFHPPLKELLKGTTTIYHEATYLDDLREKAESRFHSTAIQAAEIARDAEAELLILGHFSSRYKDITVFKDEANRIFESVEVAKEGLIFEI